MFFFIVKAAWFLLLIFFKIPTGAVGGIVTAQWAERILRQNKATLILIGRGSLDDPNWPLHAAFELKATSHQVPKQYAWAVGWPTHSRWRDTTLHDRNQTQLQDNE